MAPAPQDSSTGPLPRVDVAVIGGSGLYSLFAEGTASAFEIDTPYGPPSSPVTVGVLGGKRVAFLTRHGAGHSVPPHQIGFRANIWALASLGAKAIVSSSAVGGVHPDYPPGTLVVTDQFIDRTWGRADTFFDQGSVQHLAAADPFDPALRRFAIDALASELGSFAPSGTCVVPSEEDDSGDENTVSHELVMKRLAEAQPVIVRAIERIVEAIPSDFAPRELIPAAAVAEVLARPVSSAPRPPA
jgi:5'-methylthioadenosine phosphorylase